MDRRFLTVLGVSLVFALVVSSVFYQMTARSSGGDAAAPSEEVDIVQATRPLGIGVVIKPAEATPPAVAAEGGEDAIRIPDDHNPAGLREVGEESGKSTLESWMEAANAAEKRKIEATGQRNWYILKVQSNREDSIRDALQRKIRIEGLTDFFGDIIVPIEKVTEFKNGKKRVVKRKLYPGYIVVNMELNDDTWHIVRGTPKVTGFVGGDKRPPPISDEEVARMTQQIKEGAAKPKPKIAFEEGENVRVVSGPFANFSGFVDEVMEDKEKLRVMVHVFGRATPVVLDYTNVEKA